MAWRSGWGGSTGGSKTLDEMVEAAIVESLPDRPGQRNKLVFELARALKAIPALHDADPDDLRPIVERWHALALPVIGTRAFTETWIDFVRGWPKVMYPKGQEPMADIVARALASDSPAFVERYDQPGLHLLVGLCRELQRATGDGPFYLSTRTAGRLLDVSHVQAWRWLFLLEHDRVLQVVKRGNQKSRKATRFRYIAEPAKYVLANMQAFAIMTAWVENRRQFRHGFVMPSRTARSVAIALHSTAAYRNPA